MTIKAQRLAISRTVLAGAVILFAAAPAEAEIDGHGPDSWRVTGVASNDTLNMRMGPGTNYAVIDRLAHDARNLQQITCVPFYTAAHYARLSSAQIAALPQRWCLMRSAAMDKAGWVAQRFITPEGEAAPAAPRNAKGQQRSDPYGTQDLSADDMVASARDLVHELYERQSLSEMGGGADSPLDPQVAGSYFTDDIVAWLASGEVGAHPLYGAQDFDGSVSEPYPDADNPMYRGMITIYVDIVNFGRPGRAAFSLRADTTRPGSPLRIFHVEHDGWSYP